MFSLFITELSLKITPWTCLRDLLKCILTIVIPGIKQLAVSECVDGSPRPPPVWRFTGRTRLVIVLATAVCYSGRVWSHISKGKGNGAQSPGTQVQAPRGPLSVKSQDTLHSPNKCVNTCEMLPGFAHQRPSTQGFFLWDDHEGSFSVWHEPKFQTPRRRAGVPHKPYCCTVSGPVIHSYEFNFRKSRFSEPAKGHPRKQDSQGWCVSSLLHVELRLKCLNRLLFVRHCSSFISSSQQPFHGWRPETQKG